MNRPAAPSATRDLFGQPLKTAAELVPVGKKPPTPAAPAGQMPSETETTPVEAAAITRRRLAAECQRLRAAHRCPGRCVLRGELGRGGLAAFQQHAGGSR